MTGQFISYLLFAICGVGLCATFVFFFRFMASLQCLIHAANEAEEDRLSYSVTSVYGLWLVLRSNRNQIARKTMGKNFFWLALSFAGTMALPFAAIVFAR